MRHVLSALVTNQPGVLAQISGMLASRAFNIDSLAVGETENPEFSRITFVVTGDDRVLDQIRKQLDKRGNGGGTDLRQRLGDLLRRTYVWWHYRRHHKGTHGDTLWHKRT